MTTNCIVCGKPTMYGYALCDSTECYNKRLDQELAELGPEQEEQDTEQ